MPSTDEPQIKRIVAVLVAWIAELRGDAKKNLPRSGKEGELDSASNVEDMKAEVDRVWALNSDLREELSKFQKTSF